MIDLEKFGINESGIEKINRLRLRIEKFEKQKQLSPNDSKKYFNLLLELGRYEQENRNWEIAKDVLKKAYKIAKTNGFHKIIEVGFLLRDVGDIEMELGNSAMGIKVLQEAKKYFTRRGEEQTLAMINNSLALAYQGNGDVEQALLHFEEELNIWKSLVKLYPTEDLTAELYLASTYIEILTLYEKDKTILRVEKAAEYAKKTVALMERVCKVRDDADVQFDLAVAYSHLGGAYSDVEEYDLAIEFYQKSIDLLKSFEEKLEEDEDYLISLSHSYYKLFIIFKELGDFEKYLEMAINHHEAAAKAYEIEPENISNEILLGDSYYNLGITYVDCGDLEQAAETLEECLDLVLEFNEADGEVSEFRTIIGMSLFALKSIYQELEDTEGLIECLMTELDLLTTFAADGNDTEGVEVDLVNVNFELGTEELKSGSYENSIQCFEAALEHLEKVNEAPPEVPDFVEISHQSILASLAIAHSSLEEYEAALSYAEENYISTRKRYEENPSHLLFQIHYGMSLVLLSNHYRNVNNLDEMMDKSKEAVAVMTDYLKKDTHAVAVKLFYESSLALIERYLDAEEWEIAKEAAETFLNTAKEIAELVDKVEHEVAIITVYVKLSKCYEGLGDTATAIETAKFSLQLAENIYQEEPLHPILAELLYELNLLLADMYFDAKEVEEGLKRSEGALQIKRDIHATNPESAAATVNLVQALIEVGNTLSVYGEEETRNNYLKEGINLLRHTEFLPEVKEFVDELTDKIEIELKKEQETEKGGNKIKKWLNKLF